MRNTSWFGAGWFGAGGLVAFLFFGMSAWAAGEPATAPAVELPHIPEQTFNIVDYGAKSDGKLVTAAIVKAIKACEKAGGGTVRVPAGEYVSGPFALASNLNFHMDEGATLRFSNNPADFPLTKNRYQDCMSIKDGHDIAITGKGTIDGQGEPWWKTFNAWKYGPANAPAPPHRPNLVTIRTSQRLLIEDVTLANSPMFHLVPQGCQDVTIRGAHFHAPATAPNTDGCDPSGLNFFITNCVFDVGDDCIAVKANHPFDEDRPACENFLITNCTFLHGHGLSIGGQSSGGLKSMHVRDCTFDGTDAGIRMKAPRSDGGLVEDVTYDNLSMTNVKVAILITSYYPRIPDHPEDDKAEKVTATTPIWRNIRISNVTSEKGETAGRLLGLPEMPISDVVLTNVKISADTGFEISNAKGIVFEGCEISAKSGPAVSVAHAEVKGIDVQSGK